ncbi:hypothetical protein DY000_02007905 [Brassica cretica]|uniref:Uncharacterized protein n=1 Tax=Brassica cretica TaxID=69181 RepID=A0ABQ7CCJ6_BRACR|nr:hypothetical protein DY000_02007905 [Brassica cretica]
MVAIVILRQDENGDLYDQDGHLRYATGQKLDAQGNIIPDADATRAAQPVEEAAPPKALADYNRVDEYYANRSAIRLPDIQKENFELKPQYYTLVSQLLYSRKQVCSAEGEVAVDMEGEEDVNYIGGTGFQSLATPRASIDPQSRNMVAIVILRQDENGTMYDQDGHLRNATGQKLDA